MRVDRFRPGNRSTQTSDDTSQMRRFGNERGVGIPDAAQGLCELDGCRRSSSSGEPCGDGAYAHVLVGLPDVNVLGVVQCRPGRIWGASSHLPRNPPHRCAGASSHRRAHLVPTLRGVSVLEQPGQPHLLVFEPEEGLRRAKPLPAEDELVIEDVTDEEWEAFHEALAER